MKRMKKILSASLFVCMFIGMFAPLFLAAQVAEAATSIVKGSGRVLDSAAYEVRSSGVKTITNRLLTAVTTVSANDIWAVGYFFTSNGAPQTLTEHWNGTNWSIVASPNVGIGDNYLNGVAAVSSSDVWAVGEEYSNGFYHMLLEHWNGTSWSVVTAPNVGLGQHLKSVVAISTNNVWAVGFYYNGTVFQTLFIHWNGTSWSQVASPSAGTGDNYLQSLMVVSANNIWAVGFYFNGQETPGNTLTEQWNGTSWSIVSSPNVGTGGSNLWGGSATAANDVWAVGEAHNGSVYTTLTEHWNGTNWSVVASPNAGASINTLNAASSAVIKDVWAVGSYADSNGVSLTLIERWNGTKWKVVSSPNVGTNISLLGVTAIAANNAWAVGSYLNAAGHFAVLIEHWNGTKWNIVKGPALIS